MTGARKSLNKTVPTCCSTVMLVYCNCLHYLSVITYSTCFSLSYLSRWRSGVVVSALDSSFRSTKLIYVGTGQYWYGWPCPGSISGDEHLFRYVTSHRRPTQPSIPPGSVNEYQLWLGRQRQVWFIPLVAPGTRAAGVVYPSAGKTVRSLENVCYTWAACSRRSAIQVHVNLIFTFIC